MGNKATITLSILLTISICVNFFLFIGIIGTNTLHEEEMINLDEKWCNDYNDLIDYSNELIDYGYLELDKIELLDCENYYYG